LLKISRVFRLGAGDVLVDETAPMEKKAATAAGDVQGPRAPASMW
jgi:hypothetical protein